MNTQATQEVRDALIARTWSVVEELRSRVVAHVCRAEWVQASEATYLRGRLGAAAQRLETEGYGVGPLRELLRVARAALDGRRDTYFV